MYPKFSANARCASWRRRATGRTPPEDHHWSHRQDRLGNLPWEPGFEDRFDGLQPLLWLPRDDHPPGAWTRIDDPPI
jgi:hypothetical protein